MFTKLYLSHRWPKVFLSYIFVYKMSCHLHVDYPYRWDKSHHCCHKIPSMMIKTNKFYADINFRRLIITQIEILLLKLDRTSLFWTGPAAYSNKYIHLPEMVFALVCLGMSSVRLEHAGIRPGSAVFLIDLSSSFRGRFWRGLKKFSWANPEVLSSIVSRMISFTMKTLNHFYSSRL